MDEYFEDIEIDQEKQNCFSEKLEELACAASEFKFDRLSSFLKDNPVMSCEDNESFLAEDSLENIKEDLKAPTPLHKIINHKLALSLIQSIRSCQGVYAPIKDPVISSYDPKPLFDFEPSDPSTYYRNQIGYMFQTIDYNFKGSVGDFIGLELCIKTWIRKSINCFYEGDPTKALYIISAVLSEFVKRLSTEIMFEELNFNLEFRFHMEEYLDDALLLTLFYMDYVDDEVYCTVYQSLKPLVDNKKEEQETPLDLDFSPLSQYYTLRK